MAKWTAPVCLSADVIRSLIADYHQSPEARVKWGSVAAIAKCQHDLWMLHYDNVTAGIVVYIDASTGDILCIVAPVEG